MSSLKAQCGVVCYGVARTVDYTHKAQVCAEKSSTLLTTCEWKESTLETGVLDRFRSGSHSQALEAP